MRLFPQTPVCMGCMCHDHPITGNSISMSDPCPGEPLANLSPVGDKQRLSMLWQSRHLRIFSDDIFPQGHNATEYPRCDKRREQGRALSGTEGGRKWLGWQFVTSLSGPCESLGNDNKLRCIDLTWLDGVGCSPQLASHPSVRPSPTQGHT